MNPDTSSDDASANGAAPLWEERLFSFLHPTKIAIVEAALWIDQPLSARLLVDIFDGRRDLNYLAYHLRNLADAAVFSEVDAIPRRGALEHLYRLCV